MQVPTWIVSHQVIGKARGRRFQVPRVELFEVTKDQISVFSFRYRRLLSPECRNYLAGEMLQRGAVGAALDDFTLVAVLDCILPLPIEDELVDAGFPVSSDEVLKGVV